MKIYIVTLQFDNIKFTSTLRAKDGAAALDMALEAAGVVLDGRGDAESFDNIKIECSLAENQE